MKSGNKFSVKFKKFEITRLSGNRKREMEYSGNRVNLTVDVNEIEAITIEMPWYLKIIPFIRFAN
jgi:hypothetical protein